MQTRLQTKLEKTLTLPVLYRNRVMKAAARQWARVCNTLRTQMPCTPGMCAYQSSTVAILCTDTRLARTGKSSHPQQPCGEGHEIVLAGLLRLRRGLRSLRRGHRLLVRNTGCGIRAVQASLSLQLPEGVCMQHVGRAYAYTAQRACLWRAERPASSCAASARLRKRSPCGDLRKGTGQQLSGSPPLVRYQC